MAGIVTNKASWVWVTAAALSCGCMILPAGASPPRSKPATGTASSHPAHLDLRLPTAREIGAFPTAASPFPAASAVFAAASVDTPSWGRPRTPGNRDSNLPALGADAGEARVMSRAESFARRFHREGLPVARLWENHSALVSLGLNGKGKPGLWLVQKTH
jgi:hypothetical protein